MRPIHLAIPLLLGSACSASTPTSPTAATPQGATTTASTVAFGMRGLVTVVGQPAPTTITVQVPGGPATTVDADGRFLLTEVLATATTLIVRVDGRESIVRFPMSPLTGPQLLIELRVDASTGAAAVARLCATSTTDPSTPGTATIVSMCVSGG